LAGWGKGKFAEGVATKCPNLPPSILSSALPVMHTITIKDGSIKNLVNQSIPYPNVALQARTLLSL